MRHHNMELPRDLFTHEQIHYDCVNFYIVGWFLHPPLIRVQEIS